MYIYRCTKCHLPVFWMKPATFHLPWNTKKNMEKWSGLSMAQVFLLAHVCSFSLKDDAKAQKSIHNTFRKPSSNFLVRFFLCCCWLERTSWPRRNDICTVADPLFYAYWICVSHVYSQFMRAWYPHPFFSLVRTQQQKHHKRRPSCIFLGSSRKKWDLKAPQKRKNVKSHQSWRLRPSKSTTGFLFTPTWRITPVSEWLVTSIYKPWNGYLEGE